MVERGEEHIEIHFNRLVQILVPLIRFPMMSQSKLANLLAFNQITKSYTDILVRLWESSKSKETKYGIAKVPVG